VSSSAVLFGDGTIRAVTTQMEQALNTSIGGLSLSSLGLSFNSTNDLVLDTSTLSTTLSQNLDGAMSLLATQTTTSSSALSVIDTGSSPPASFALDLTVDSSGALTAASVGGNSSLFTVSGKSIIGNANTIYAGMAFTYTGTTSTSVTVSSTIGIAAQIYNLAKSSSGTSTGSFQTLINNLQTRDDSMQQQIDDINSRAALYKTMLTNQYAQYQAAISTADSTLNYLSALLNSGTSNG
jgi:flagellar hook-associated protein 2